jgi:hypothetical protein
MKKILLTLFTMLVLVGAGRAQTTTFIQDLDQIIAYANDCKGFATSTRSALRSLAIQYFQLGNPNPNVAAYLTVMDANMSGMESTADEIILSARNAATKNPALDVSSILSWASQLEAREDFIRNQSATLANAIALNNVPAARAANNLIRGYLNEQISISNDIIANAQFLKTIPQAYNVRITLVDHLGNPVGGNGLQGYFAENSSNQIIWPTNQEGDLFEGLSGGTYTFGAIDGYFDGASSTTVTLTASLIQANGEVVVSLVYWSE